jgi:hypothetical protein
MAPLHICPDVRARSRTCLPVCAGGAQPAAVPGVALGLRGMAGSDAVSREAARVADGAALLPPGPPAAQSAAPAAPATVAALSIQAGE